MQASKHDRRLSFLRAAVIDDGLQERLGPFVPYGSAVWARREQISDGERFRAGGIGQDLTARFQVRWSEFTASILQTDRLVCEGSVYGVAGLKELGRREGIEITASRIEP